jgi:hypothetical protein
VTGQFDAKKSIREELVGLSELRVFVVNMERRARDEYTMAEEKHNTALKLIGFIDSEVQRKRDRLREIEEQER